MKKMLFLINPVSGKLVLNDSLMEVIEVFANGDYEINVRLTKNKDDMIETAKNADQYDIVVCCGGDGTLNIVAGAVYEKGADTLIGYIPGGTTNDFANSRRIDTVAVGAAKQIVEGKIRDTDLGLLNGLPFVYVAAFGMFSDVSYMTSRELKQNLGHAAYLLEGLKSIGTAKPYNARIIYDGGIIEGDFIYGMVSNSRRVGGFEMPIMQNVLYDDGEMEMLIVRHPKSAADIQKIINSLVTQTPDDSMVYMFKTTKAHIESIEDIPWSLDGEYGGSYADAVIEVKEAAVKMIF
ncbi:MAG: diacylglycerol kinase family lipid kinase [Clostridia bacterium]|nr:diacylglycerol kinase family lipid kinase [Clostridia bacterium]